MIINIKLVGSQLSVIDPPVIAAESANTVRFRLEADAEWAGLTTTVVFRRVFPAGVDARSVVAAPGTVYPVPPEVLHAGWLYIGAKGVAQNGQIVLTTAKMEHPLRVNESEADAAASSGTITASMADQILALIGDVSNLDTASKSSLVNAINEVNKDAVKSVNSVKPDKAGNVTVAAGGLQIVRAVHTADDVYTATGDALPLVVPGYTGQHTGKGSQIVFIPGGENTTAAPKLQLNGGSKVQIRMRAPRNRRDDSQSPDATLPVPVGALMNGVPYTMTFCGYFWLIDSAVHYPTFVVEMTKSSDGTITVDKTFAQIKSAYAAGQQIVCACYDESAQWDARVLLPLESFHERGVAHFGRVVETSQDLRELVTAYINSGSSGDYYGLNTWEIKDLPNIPTPTKDDAGKVPVASESGNYVLQTFKAAKDGKSAYQYAQDGGYTGTEAEFAEKLAQEMLSGTTGELTPTQVYEAVSAGIPVKVQYTDNTYGVLSFTAFNVSESLNVIVSEIIAYGNGVYMLCELFGDKSSNRWGFNITTLAQKTDIPTQLPNPNALQFTGAVTGSYDGSAPLSVKIPSAVTDDHINELINTALNAIGVAEEGAY